MIPEGKIHIGQDCVSLLDQCRVAVYPGILLDGDERCGQPGVVYRGYQLVVACVVSDHWRVSGDPVPLVEDTVGVSVGTVWQVRLLTGLPGAQLVQHSGDFRLSSSSGRTPGPAQVIGGQPGEGVEADLGGIGVGTAGESRRPPTVGQVVDRGLGTTQVGPGGAGNGIRRVYGGWWEASRVGLWQGSDRHHCQPAAAQ